MKKHTFKFIALMIRSAFLAFVGYCCVCWWMCDKYAPPTELPEDKTHVPLKEATDQPAYFDGSYYCDTLTVIQPGHPLLDLWMVTSFRAKDDDGIEIQIFHDSSSRPSSGERAIVEGVFRLTENNYYFRNNCCLFAVKVKVLPREK